MPRWQWWSIGAPQIGLSLSRVALRAMVSLENPILEKEAWAAVLAKIVGYSRVRGTSACVVPPSSRLQSLYLGHRGLVYDIGTFLQQHLDLLLFFTVAQKGPFAICVTMQA